MKLNRGYVISTAFTCFLVGMLFGFQNCAKQKELQAQMDQNALSVTDTNKRMTDLENIMSGMLEEEKAARIAADQDLSTRIEALSKDLIGYQQLANASISSLSSRADADSALMTKNKTELESKIMSSSDSLKDLISKNNDGLQSQLNSSLEKILSLQGQSDDQKKLLIDQSTKISNLSQSTEEFKTLVSNTYATKLDIENLKTMYENLVEVTKNLDLKIDHTKDEVLSILGDEVNDLATKLNIIDQKVNDQGKSIEILQSDVASAILEYRSSFSSMSADFRNQVLDTESRMGLLMDQKNALVKKEIFKKMNRDSLKLTLFTKKAVSGIANSIAKLEAQVSKLSSTEASNKDALQTSIANLRKDMTSALADEQIARNKIAADVEILTQRMKRVENDLIEIKSMTEANSKMIARMGSDFENEKKNVADRFQVQKEDVDQKLNQLKTSFADDLKDLATKSENLVRNLGDDVRNQFKTITSDVAILNSRQSNLEHNLKNFIEEYQVDKAKTVQFEQNLFAPKKEITSHLSNVIDSLSQLQLRFVQILAPDENNKDFYDEDFKSIANECKGVDEASFSNALGLDSFQVLSIEYSRMLITGLRSGDGERDKIFYDYGEIEDENSFSRSIALGLVKNSIGSEDGQCLAKIQNWARGIILTDKRFKDISIKLANDDEFERRVEVLYSAFDSVKDPAVKIQSILEKMVSGMSGSEAAYQIISAQTVLDLINGAWDQRMLSDRLALLDNFEKIQTSQSELADEMKAGFSDLRSTLNSYQSSTNLKIANLEKEQGAMKTSLKRALDVLISLSDRAGFQDLKAYSIWAGSAIDYTPVIYPNWKPEVQMVQHFFSGPKSLINNSDACTGNKILTTGGIQSYYQFGKWGPCWVNFRNIPLTQWGNETKTLWLRIFGAGNVVNLAIDSTKQKEAPQLFTNYNFNKNYDFSNLTNLDPTLKFNGVYSKAVYDIKVPTLLDYYVKNIRTWGGITISVTTSKVEQIGNQTVKSNSNVFDYNIQLFSPLILDFHKKSLPNTLAVSESNVYFDHRFEGVEKRTGWVAGHEAAFLVHLKNRNKIKITGADLFGEGTIIGDQKAKNGFEALSYFDKNNDKKIDIKDPIWNNLYAFFDYNQNGDIDPGEIVKLSTLGIDHLNLNFKTVPEEIGLKNGNDFRYISESFNSKNEVVAKIYDIYFGIE